MLLADECWLLAHDDTTGNSHLPPRIAGIAAASGLLAELLHARIITVNGDQLGLRQHQPPTDLLQHTVTDHLAREKHPVDTWLRYFARTAENEIATRLIRAGILQEHKSRNILGKTKRRYIPTTSGDAAWPTARIANRLSQGRPVNDIDQILIGWIDATGLTPQVLWDDPRQIGAQYLTHIVQHLPADHRALAGATKTLISHIVMTHH